MNFFSKMDPSSAEVSRRRKNLPFLRQIDPLVSIRTQEDKKIGRKLNFTLLPWPTYRGTNQKGGIP
jgi:hypothetical protein